MPLVDGFTVSEVPGLRSPVVIMAFTGWSDTGTVTVDTAQHLVDAYNGEQFLTVDPEDYYVFTDSRPHVRIDEEGVRRLDWPKNEAYFARMPDAPNDLVIVMGAEPNLRWRTFSERLTDAISALNPSLICTLVARPAATPHTRPIPVTGSSADPRLAARFGLGRSLYQGPTGILGVLHDSLRRRGANLISLAAGVPHYLNVEENPPATLALLHALEPVLGIAPPIGDLEDEVTAFASRVEEASRGDDQIASYVRTLEEGYGEGDGEVQPEAGGELPSADDILRDVEDFLRGGDR
ncbi:MAG: carboxylate--amine ligase [Dehalococcoidia bacterium]|nr:MAG: carboxylate--amine ligase [Dehalococcoidia bacterium]